MRYFIVLLTLVLAGAVAQAQTSTSDLIGLGMKPEIASELAKGMSGKTSYAIVVDGDSNRVFTFDATGDTGLSTTWGDGGTTAGQNYDIKASTADADDDGRLCLTGGGACADNARGGYLFLSGNEDTSGQGQVTLSSGSVGTSDVKITASDDVIIQGDGSGDTVTIAGGGTTVDLTIADNLITVASGTTLTGGAGAWGWVRITGSNTACATTCGISACIMGWDAAAASMAGILTCADATADECLCTGPAA
jgi:hypothetical protein